MQFGIFKKVQALSERFTAFRVRMVWGPQWKKQKLNNNLTSRGK
jgi:hypothetical protein